MPNDFPSDFPIYPGSRLTVGDSYTTGGRTSWYMLWETLDGVDKVKAFYAARLNQGDWTFTFSANQNGEFGGQFNRKSATKTGGILGANIVSGVTLISLSLENQPSP